jgi:hypothetical protein
MEAIPMARTPMSVRLRPDVETKLDQVAEQTGLKKAEIINRAICVMHDAVQGEARESAARSTKLLARLKLALGEQFWRDFGVDEVAFEAAPSGRVAVHVADVRFMDDDSGGLLAARLRGGRAEFAEVTDAGLGEWIAAPLGDPILN